MEQISIVFEMLHNATGIPLFVVKQGGEMLISFSDEASPLFTGELARACIDDFLLKKRDMKHPLLMTLDSIYFIGIAQLDEYKFLILGPVATYQHDLDNVNLYTFSSFNADYKDMFSDILASAPIGSPASFIHSFSLAIQLYDGRLINLEELLLVNKTEQILKLDSTLTHYVFTSQEEKAFHTPQSYEEGIIKAIEEGNMEALKRRERETATGRLGILSFDSLRQAKYIFVTSAAIFARAAMRGGLDYEMACSIADIYCQQMDRLTNSADIYVLIHKMSGYFCERVAEMSLKVRYSSTVQTCCNYIAKNLHESISLGNLADISKMSARRLSQRFQKETGYSIVDYIHKAKMQEAEYLLRHTTHTISEISNYLHYSSQSYFSNIFKEIYNVSPQKYRNYSAINCSIL